MSYTPLYLFAELHFEPVFTGEEVEDEEDFVVEVKDYLAGVEVVSVDV